MARSSLLAIVCHWCGRDYAHEYWTAAATFEHPKRLRIPDPRVCFSCRRDTNPDYAQDAPRGGPPQAEEVTADLFPVTPGRKQCRMCRQEYDGLIFGSPILDPSVGPLPFGICPTCADADAARDIPVVPVGVPLVLARPVRALEGADD